MCIYEYITDNYTDAESDNDEEYDLVIVVRMPTTRLPLRHPVLYNVDFKYSRIIHRRELAHTLILN